MGALRLMTANLCFISPLSNVRRAVPLGLGGFLLSVVLLLLLRPLREVVVGGGVAAYVFSAYLCWGVAQCKGVQGPAAIAVAALAEQLAGGTGVLLCAASVLGCLFASLGSVAQLLTIAIRAAWPAWLFDAQQARLDLFGSLLDGYDVVCLQEATVTLGMDSHVRAIRAAAAARGLVHFCSSGRWPKLPSVFATDGLALLSRLPISRTMAFSYSSQAFFEWSLVQRGALFAELAAADGSKIAVMNVHTTAGLEVLEDGVGKRTAAARTNHQGLTQLSEALQAFAEFAQDAKHKIVAGDFNLRKDSAHFKALEDKAKSLGLHDCFPSCPPTFGCLDEPLETLLTKPACQKKPKVLDHVFSNIACHSAEVNKMAAPDGRSEGFQQVSDHRAVVVTWK